MKYFFGFALLAMALAQSPDVELDDHGEPLIIPMPRQLDSEDRVIIPQPRRIDDDDEVVIMPRQNLTQLDFQTAEEDRVIIPMPRQQGQEQEQVQSRTLWQTYSISRVNDLSDFLQSPNYPYGYPSNSQFNLFISSPQQTNVVMDCQDFHLEPSTSCQKDSLLFSLSGSTDFYDGMIACGQRSFTLTSHGNEMAVRFFTRSRQYYGNFRFSCNIFAVPDKSFATTPTTTTTTPKPTTTTTRTTTTTVPTTTKAASSSSSSSAASATCVCGARNEQPRIVSGVESGVNEFPWRCYLSSKNYGSYCGATVISDQWIMTAAHCTEFLKPADEVKVVCGDHNMMDKAVTTRVVRSVDRIMEHKEYNNKTMNNDISLMHLTQKLTWSKTLSPICLPWNRQGNNCEGAAQNTVVVSGWGLTKFQGEPSSVLRKVELPCLSTVQCRQYYHSSVTDNMICTYSPEGKDACQGDSGGSVDLKNSADSRYYALGVVSWGQGCAAKNSPGVYTKITNYLDWIKTSTGDNSFCL